MTEKFKPSDLGVKPEKILNNGKASIKIEAKEIQVDRINREKLNRAGLRIDIQGSHKPRLAVFGVPSEITVDEIKNGITGMLNRETGEQERHVEIRAKFGPRGKNYHHWVIEVDPGTRKSLLAREKVYLAWSACHVKDHVRVIRCYKCQKYGHLQDTCRSEKEICGRCGMNHDTRDCCNLELSPRCTNCLAQKLKDTAHEASSKNCPIYVRKINELVSHIEYDLNE